jgi:lipid II:glycine glycyltransferase (peptidoglycan interpeptide bridge formation enzyme)
MNIKVVENVREWDEFLKENGSPSFLQAAAWADFNERAGYKVWRLGIYDGSKLTAIALTIKITSKRGTFLFIPHGPVLEVGSLNPETRKSVLKTLRDYLIQLARDEKCSFIRIAPTLELSDVNLKIFRNLGFRTAPIYMQSERMWVLPLNKTEDELMAAMRKTTRYLIRRGAKDGVVIEKRTDSGAVDDFWKIYEKTVEREKFTPFSKKYIRDEFEVFNKAGDAMFLFASHQSQYLAAALIIFTKSTAFYHQGASIHSKIPATYVIQWEAIREAKKRGCQYYSFWGIAKPGRTPNWSGLTLFKTGFGGHQIDYVPTQDFILSSRYTFTFLLEKSISLKRKF